MVYWKLMKFFKVLLKKNNILSVHIKDKSCNSPEDLQFYLRHFNMDIFL